MAVNPERKGSKLIPVKSFRIDEDVIRELAKIAKSEHNSLNAVVNNILYDYVYHIRPSKLRPVVIIECAILKEVIGWVSDEDLSDHAHQIGEKILKEFYAIAGWSNNVLTFRNLMRDGVCYYGGWAKYGEVVTEDKVIMELNHNMGLKWSIFMKSFYYPALAKLEDANPSKIQFLCTDTDLIITIPLK